jgi:hypothetical protein
MWSDNNVREPTEVEVPYTSVLNINVVAFKALPLESYAPMLEASPPIETIFN